MVIIPVPGFRTENGGIFFFAKDENSKKGYFLSDDGKNYGEHENLSGFFLTSGDPEEIDYICNDYKTSEEALAEFEKVEMSVITADVDYRIKSFPEKTDTFTQWGKERVKQLGEDIERFKVIIHVFDESLIMSKKIISQIEAERLKTIIEADDCSLLFGAALEGFDKEIKSIGRDVFWKVFNVYKEENNKIRRAERLDEVKKEIMSQFIKERQ